MTFARFTPSTNTENARPSVMLRKYAVYGMPKYLTNAARIPPAFSGISAESDMSHVSPSEVISTLLGSQASPLGPLTSWMVTSPV